MSKALTIAGPSVTCATARRGVVAGAIVGAVVEPSPSPMSHYRFRLRLGRLQPLMVEWLALASASAGHVPVAKAGEYPRRVCRLPWLGTIGTGWPGSRLVSCGVQTQGG